MIELLKKLIFGHAHQWETLKEIRIYTDGGHSGTMYHLRCKHCGKISYKRIMA